MINCLRIFMYVLLIIVFILLLSSMKCNTLIQEDYQDDKLDSLVEKVKKVFSNYRKDIDKKTMMDASGMPVVGDEKILVELSLDNVIDGNNLSFDGHDESYTINKKRVHICMKDENNQYYEDNMLMYVLLHELAHCKSRSIGHTPEFHRILDKIYYIAKRTGLLSPFFVPDPGYCSHNHNE